MDRKPVIERLVESIKAYFSITGLIVVGVYLVNNADEAPFGWRIVDQASGFVAIGIGAIVACWYGLHVAHELIRERHQGELGRAAAIAYGVFIALATLVVAAIVLGAITQSCGKVFH
jgi:hypothetical protein